LGVRLVARFMKKRGKARHTQGGPQVVYQELAEGDCSW
jgi:hypothetical protein